MITATLAIMIGVVILNAATFIGGNYLAKLYQGIAAKLHWMKKSGMTKLLKNIKRIMRNTKKIAQNSLTGLQNKIVKKIELYTIFKILTKHWPSTIKQTQRKGSTSKRTRVL